MPTVPTSGVRPRVVPPGSQTPSCRRSWFPPSLGGRAGAWAPSLGWVPGRSRYRAPLAWLLSGWAAARGGVGGPERWRGLLLVLPRSGIAGLSPASSVPGETRRNTKPCTSGTRCSHFVNVMIHPLSPREKVRSCQGRGGPYLHALDLLVRAKDIYRSSVLV